MSIIALGSLNDISVDVPSIKLAISLAKYGNKKSGRLRVEVWLKRIAP